ncbi:MAG: DUF2511 domain-containing protein [Elainellaceae cyanobacterium]
MSKKIYQRNWLIFILLFTLPPIAAGLVWTTQWKQWAKIVVLLWGILSFGIFAFPPQEEQTAFSEQETVEEPIESTETEDSTETENLAESESEDESDPVEETQPEAIEESQPTAQPEQELPEGYISKETWDGEWSFSVDKGRLNCFRWKGQPTVTFIAGGYVYPLNSPAQAARDEMEMEPLETIWLNDPDVEGARLSIGPFIQEGLKQCGE